jgi:glycosidase
MKTKPVIYQILPRLFGNSKKRNIQNGTIEENGCGKMSSFTGKVLSEIRLMGVTHIWFTGLIEHASQTPYPEDGIAADHPEIVKGLAGSPYAIRDCYDISPDLADKVPQRMAEFEHLVTRCHKNGLKVIIDFVPNHVARNYHSDARPPGTADIGENDKAFMSFDPNNNYYYIPGQVFTPPEQNSGSHYREFPAKATGNNCFSAHPTKNDWYETVKLNYGTDHMAGGTQHFDPVPDTWYKMRNILLYWAGKGIDGFRCDMASMIPVEFWEWAIPAVKAASPGLIFIAEIYEPCMYGEYLHRGQFDYLYDKVGMYDTLRAIIRGEQPASSITHSWQALGDLLPDMLNFLENHDEPRIASDFFASDARKAIPAFVTAAALNTCPVMIYAGQELGERGMDCEGFSGLDGRTSIYDYWTVSSLHQWYSGGRMNETLLTDAQRSLRQFYVRIMQLCNSSPAIREGRFFDLMYVNPAGAHFNPTHHYAWLRCHEDDVLLIAVNFSDAAADIRLHIPDSAFSYFDLSGAVFATATDALDGSTASPALAADSCYPLHVPPCGARIIHFCRRPAHAGIS